MTFPAMRAVSIETRAEYVDRVELGVLQRVLREGEVATDLEIAIGVEAFDDRIRNEVFRKGLPRNGIHYLSALAGKYGVRINMHLNPTYVARGAMLEEHFSRGEYRTTHPR